MNPAGHIHVDVIIVGAGVAGASFAAILKGSGLSCALVEAEPSSKDKSSIKNIDIDIDPRALALTHASKNILQSIGAWDEIPQDRIGLFRKMHVWDEHGLGEVNPSWVISSSKSLLSAHSNRY